MNSNDPVSLLEAIKWLSGIAMAILAWVGIDKLRDNREEHRRFEERISALEKTVATKADISGVYERINEVGDKMSDENRTILQTLLDWRARGR